MEEINSIGIDRNRVARILVIIAIIILILSMVSQLIQYLTSLGSFHGITYLFSLGLECNIPTYFISSLSFISSLLLLIITLFEHNRKESYVVKWAILAVGFLFISIDEIVQLHERLIDPVSRLLNREDLGIFTFGWVIPGIAIVVLLALYFYKFIMTFRMALRLNFLWSALMFLSGAIGFELISGGYYSVHGSENLTYRMMQNVEESLEMAGLILFIWSLMLYMSERYKSLSINFTSGLKTYEADMKK